MNTDIEYLQEQFEQGKLKRVSVEQVLPQGKLFKVEWRDLEDNVIRSDIQAHVDASFFAASGASQL